MLDDGNVLREDRIPTDDAVVDSLLRGAVDIHCHAGPSVMERSVDHREQIREAAAAGMRAILFKDHFYSAAPVTILLTKYANPGDPEVLSGVPLNNALGGLNPYAVEHGLKLGARIVWLPTICASNHLRTAFRYNLAGKLGMMAPTGIPVLTERFQVRDELKEILDLIAAHDAVLSGGHSHVSELYPIFEEAKRRGVKRLLVSHPTFWIEAQTQDLSDLSAMGVYLEHCACMLIDCPSKKFTHDQLKSYIAAGGVEQTILGSDLGQPFNPHPVAGMREVIRLCLDLGYSPADIRAMTSTNACRLLGIEPPAELEGSLR